MAKEDRFALETSARKNGIEYTGLTATWDLPLNAGFIPGSWGRSNEERDGGRIYRLGFILGDMVAAVSLILSEDPGKNGWLLNPPSDRCDIHMKGGSGSVSGHERTRQHI